jgi:hypothetical protein
MNAIVSAVFYLPLHFLMQKYALQEQQMFTILNTFVLRNDDIYIHILRRN